MESEHANAAARLSLHRLHAALKVTPNVTIRIRGDTVTMTFADGHAVSMGYHELAGRARRSLESLAGWLGIDGAVDLTVANGAVTETHADGTSMTHVVECGPRHHAPVEADVAALAAALEPGDRMGLWAHVLSLAADPGASLEALMRDRVAASEVRAGLHALPLAMTEDARLVALADLTRDRVRLRAAMDPDAAVGGALAALHASTKAALERAAAREVPHRTPVRVAPGRYLALTPDATERDVSDADAYRVYLHFFPRYGRSRPILIE